MPSAYVEEMKDYCEREGITRDSDLEVVVEEVVRQVRMTRTERESMYESGFYGFVPANHSGIQETDPVRSVYWTSKDEGAL